MTQASNRACDAQQPSTATSSRLYKHQMGADTERGQSLALGVCRLAPAAYELREHRGFPLCVTTSLPVELAGRHARSFSRISIGRFVPSLTGRLVVGLRAHYSARPIITHSSRLACQPFARRQSLSDQQHFQCLADPDHSSVLSEGCTVREVSCATKGLGNVRKVFGELRNV